MDLPFAARPMNAPLPEDEDARLCKLRGFEILDTPSEHTFERLARMTARLFTVPMAAVTLVDAHRQWFKARRGLKARETCRDHSFCAHAILRDEVMVIEDAQQDARFAANPSVTGAPHIRFYAGAPLRTSDGFRLGALCVMDRAPRRFSSAESQTLLELADIVVDEMTLRKVAGHLRHEVARHERTQKTLRRKQRTLLDLRGSLEERIRQRTTDLTGANAALRAEIARREQLEVAHANLARLIEESSDFISLATMDGQPTYINEAGLRLVGLDSLEEAGHLNLLNFFPPEDQAFVREVAAKTLLQQGRWESDCQFRHFRTGETIPVSWNQFIVKDPRTGEPASIATVTRDITERKRTEAALRLAKDEADKANHAKSEFLSRMSHELRTPLNAILGFGQILQAQIKDAGHKHCATHVVTAGRHLLNLINEVLDVARIESGRVELSLEPVSVEGILVETLDLIRPLTVQHHITIEAPAKSCGEFYVMADRQRVRQVLLNLLSNAIKYGPPNSRVVVECQPVRPWQLRMSVRDFGPGIAPDKAARLFVAFDRLGAEGGPVQGTGLGLALSKHLVEAMHGNIGMDSRPGEGSTFWIQLPQAYPPPRQVPPVPVVSLLNGSLSSAHGANGSATQARPCTVLYIEDDPSNLSLVEYVLTTCQRVQLFSAIRGEEGLEIARRQRPDLILLDLHLPDIPGRDMLAALQRDERTRAIPVVALSADASRQTIAGVLDAGASGYLTKPLNVEHLLHTLSVLRPSPNHEPKAKAVSCL